MNGLLHSSFPQPPSGKTGWPWTAETDPAVYDPDFNWPKITIVTASFNQGNFIEETIRSVLLQNYPNLEYIIIDGGSSDQTVEIIQKYSSFISYWVSEKDSGQSDAINKGLKVASGEIFNWLNSDDYLSASALHTIAKLFADANRDVVSCRVHNFSHSRSYITEASGVFSFQKNSLAKPNINQPGTFFRMKTIRELGPLNPSLHYCMDLEWWMKYLLKNDSDRVYVSDEVVANFREHEDSKTISFAPRFVEDKFQLFSAILARKDSRFKPMGEYRFENDLSAVPLRFLQALFNKSFFDQAIYSYGKREMKRVLQLLAFVDPELLSETDRNLFSRMKFRANYFPSFLFKLIGKN